MYIASKVIVGVNQTQRRQPIHEYAMHVRLNLSFGPAPADTTTRLSLQMLVFNKHACRGLGVDEDIDASVGLSRHSGRRA